MAYSVKRNTVSDQKVMPIRVTFDYQQHVTHHFTDKSPNKQITLTLGVQNTLQDPQLHCRYEVTVEASQSWKKGSKGRYSVVDVSEGESFLWAGKTTYRLKNFKPNVSHSIP